MKKIITLFLTLFLITSTSANDLFLYDAEGKNEFSEVDNNNLVILPSTLGKTYSLSKNLSITTSTNGVVTTMLPYRIAVTQREDSASYYNESDTEYANKFTLPEVVKISNHYFNFSSMGQIYVVSEADKQLTIGTSMAMIVFDKAKLYINSGERFTQVYVVEGIVTVLDNKSSKKKKEINAGDYLVVTPQPMLSPKQMAVSRNLGSSFSIKDVEDVEKDIHLNEINALQTKLDNVIFVNYDKNIFGFKVNDDSAVK